MQTFAQGSDSPLLITSHEIRIHHTTRDAREDKDIGDIITFFYDITEIMEIKNTGNEPYTETLNFVTQLDDDDPEDLKIEIVRENGEKKSEGIKFAINKEGEIFIEFKEENITEIKPQETIQLKLEYRVYFLRDDYTKPDVWKKVFRYLHAKDSLIIKANPVGSADYYFYAEPFNLHKSKTESGYWESPPLSPSPETVYKVMTRKGERPTPTPERAVIGTETQNSTNERIQPSATREITYPKSSSPNKLLLGLIGINIVLVATVVFLTIRNTKSAT